MKDFKNMTLEERRKYFQQRLRGGEQSKINQDRIKEAKKFHKRFYEKMKEQENIER